MSADLVPLKCPADALDSLAGELRAFGPSGGAPDWLLTGVWLECEQSAYLASPSIEVMDDGFLARPLVIEAPDDVRSGVEDALPDIQARLLARGSHVELPETAGPPERPGTLQEWPDDYSMAIALRIAASPLQSHRIACGLVFTTDAGRRLLVGTDRTTLAMVLSEDPQLVDLYCGECELVSVAQYRQLVAA